MSKAIDTLDFSSISDEERIDLLNKRKINLSVHEALTIQNEFLKRPPTYAECVLWSIQGSEHCSYKSTRQHLKKFNTQSPDVILGAKEDAGIVSVAVDNQGHRYGVIVSHESHNHPSQIVPYEGAATGVGGNVRDVCCMGGEVIAVADALRFGDLSRAQTHWIYQGVVQGIAGYGNPLGVPNIAGDVYFDRGYNDNCLVTVVTLGIVREKDIIHSYAPANASGYVYILVGKPTDNSGFGGASFASTTLKEEAKDSNKGAVQEPNAFLQRHLLKANYALFRWLRNNNLIDKVGFKDLGAGGIACASLELAEAGGDYGAEITLENVHTGMDNLSPAVILCSETQERFMWVVPESLADKILTHYNVDFALPSVSYGARATRIGRVTEDGLFKVRFEEDEIVHARVKDITQGILYDRPFTLKKTQDSKQPIISEPEDYNKILLNLLAHENIASKAPVYETYDKQVQGRTVIEAGQGDAGVMQPFNSPEFPCEIQKVGIALSLDQNPDYNRLDPYWGAVNAVVESIRNVAAVGAYPVALTDCLCFGNPENPEQMGEFVSAVQGIIDACAALKLKNHPNHSLPVIAGNVSLYNDTPKGAIPPSPMISCLGVMNDVNKALTYPFKRTDSYLILAGELPDTLDGSVYYKLRDQSSQTAPKPSLEKLHAEIMVLHDCIERGLILSAHDVSDGGIAVALAEMSFAKAIGCEVSIPVSSRLDCALFGEGGGFILEVQEANLTEIQKSYQAAGVPCRIIGRTRENPLLTINQVINLDVAEAKKTWENGLRARLL